MHSWHWLTALVAMVALVWVASGPATATADEPVKITVKTVDTGFEPNEIEVPTGSLVELTFEWSHTVHTTDEHIVVIPAYKVESDPITSANRKSTVKFVADKSGTFNFACDLECEAHDAMQKGVLKVVTGGGAKTAALTPTKFTIDPSGITVRGGTVTVTGFLTDEGGAPIPKAELIYRIDDEFVAIKGKVEVGTAKTGPSGLAKLSFEPRRPDPPKLTIVFEGQGIYAPTEKTVDLPPVVNPGSGFTEEPRRLGSIRSGAPIMLVVVLGATWLTFAGVLFTARGLSRAGQGR